MEYLDRAARFDEVRSVFEENFASRGDVGASVAVSVNNELVVDLWAGHQDAARTRPWQADTIVTTYSTTKGLVALCAHMLADRGQLDFDAPVVRYWPEFGQHGKESVLARHVFTHSAGLPAIREPLPTEAIFDWKRMTEALAAEELWWEPGTTMGYHSVTYGFLAGEIIRRACGRSVGTFLREEVTEPLGADFFIGFGPELDGRVAETIASAEDPVAQSLADPESLRAKVFHNPPAHNSDRSIPNSTEWRRSEIPSVNGHGNARGLARIYGALASGGEASGVQLLSPEAAAEAGAVVSEGPDVVYSPDMPVRRALGFAKPHGFAPQASDGAYGHGGQGGSLGFADPELLLGFGYVPNQMVLGQDERGRRLNEAVYASLP